ncbi:hypothetical protein BST92_12080 [Nonlabens arenilitoris]|uniref:Lipoprotein n=1 Tax=Nonlabens arenilitoris TaxID=1217969 RepID=A0A2S7UDC5_9FLAO|nr:hypothetical protein [Nonlabens arenilitoris]PQJ32620.1 hypothetical protein BST92_12080 [Nonlabens arenilitoris]
MKQLLLLLLILSSISCKDAKDITANGEIVNDDISKQVTVDNVLSIDKEFPQDFLGAYKGELKITTSRGTESIPMEFHLLKTTDSMNYQYKIFYGEERSERAYNLKKTHNPNLYLVDENNGIVLETAYADQTLFSTYEVMGNLLNCTEVFHDDYMEFMITMARVQDTSMTGNAESAIVKNYPLSVMQKAVLFKE